MNNPIPNEQNSKMPTAKNLSSSSSDYAVQQQRITRAAKLELLREKTTELEELTRIKDLSAQLGQHFDRLANNVQGLSEGAQDVSNVVGNWDYVFGTMGLMNTDSGPGSRNPTIVNLPIMSNTKNN
ncbi:hypothetical protein BCR42DRAFT_456232 [Absidia repens]|uniref:Uncharacterized protein n=1 Tax=Absidia repens TaxID=90262 RepID=A0A1X2I0X8_9FUNG|nr:hypothetical protein BCR42DRAFT_456232 [Absidia repens]